MENREQSAILSQPQERRKEESELVLKLRKCCYTHADLRFFGASNAL
jgi:hypothetical protein